ncbi:hypothetical protein Jiend_37400 [Micromonospora endophytica]|nr:hypothetical protein Jiend_37400 [Micromonospora endophytica]
MYRSIASATVASFEAREQVARRLDAALVRYDAWYVVLLAVILALAVTIFAGLLIWCVVYKDRRFTGNWSWNWSGVSVNAECV